jgi:hypothetical protein
VRRIPVWRIAAAVLVLAALVFFVFRLAPAYLHNWQLGRYLHQLAASSSVQAATDGELRSLVVNRARELALPVAADNVRIDRSRAGLRLEVRYVVGVDLPGYTVTLHFRPGASRD